LRSWKGCWDRQESGVDKHLQTIIWTGSQYVIVGGQGLIRTSTDGINWTTQNSGTVQWINGIAWSSSQFVAVGNWGTILTSPDGINWTSQTSSSTSSKFRKVAWTGTRFVVVGMEGAIITSFDGINWTEQATGLTDNLWGVTVKNNKVVVVGQNGVVLTSEEGVTTSPSAAPARITELERPQRLTIDTELLANYPNPFNPETWIPYRLAEAANVTLTIYDIQGTIVRRIEVGHQQPAVYVSRDKAIYFDGRNNNGEQVSSGVYFYHLKAGDFSATKKMLILK